MARGLYGQREGNETNPNAQADFYADLDAMYSGYIKSLRALCSRHDWKAVEAFVTKLKLEGFGATPIRIITTAAMRGVRV